MRHASLLSAREAQRRASDGRSSALAVAEAVASRIEERQDTIRAFAYFDKARFLDQARCADQAGVRGKLHAVTVAVKDTILTKDMPTEHNAARYRGSRPGIDAACVDTLRAHGALIVGKTVTTELAATTKGSTTRNPHDIRCSPGGSSSGSAAAVADMQSAIAIGSQTGGSVIRPASYCGVFGWKPSWGAISNEGIKSFAPSCDTVGFFARTASDLTLLAEVYGLAAIETAPVPERISVAICKTPFWDRALPATREALVRAARMLRAAMIDVDEVVLPPDFSELDAARRTIVGHEGAASLLNETVNSPPPSEDVLAVLASGARSTRPDRLRAAYRIADACRASLDEIGSRWDAIVAPSATGEAPTGLSSTGDATFNSMWTLLHVPVVNVPGLSGPNGMPVGVSLIGGRHDDMRLLKVAERVGRVLRRPRDATRRQPNVESES